MGGNFRFQRRCCQFLFWALCSALQHSSVSLLFFCIRTICTNPKLSCCHGSNLLFFVQSCLCKTGSTTHSGFTCYSLNSPDLLVRLYAASFNKMLNVFWSSTHHVWCVCLSSLRGIVECCRVSVLEFTSGPMPACGASNINVHLTETLWNLSQQC